MSLVVMNILSAELSAEYAALQNFIVSFISLFSHLDHRGKTANNHCPLLGSKQQTDIVRDELVNSGAFNS